MSNGTNTNKKLAIKDETVDLVLKKVQQFQADGEVHLPANYSLGNALKSAWLQLQQAVDKNKKPVLEACSKESIANALLDMAVQGLNPGKNQCYFIAYGQKLTLMRSYHGTIAVSKTIANVKEVYPVVIYDGDKLSYSIKHGQKTITNHEQQFGNIDMEKIAGAYCVVVFKDGSEYTDLMTIDQIKKSWSKSKINPESADSTHSLFTEEMVKRTVTNRACKAVINSSSDSALFLQAYNRDSVVDDPQKEIEANANSTIIDIKAELPEPQPEPEPDLTPEGEIIPNNAGIPVNEIEPGPGF